MENGQKLEYTGIVFKRVDIYGKPEIKPSIELVDDLVRNTSVSQGHVKLHTIEHVMSALWSMNVDNVVVEMNAAEPPILDGSAKHSTDRPLLPFSKTQ